MVMAVSLATRGNRLSLKICNMQSRRESEVPVDGVVAGIGIQPNVELAQMAGLRIENGIVVDELLRTSHPDIYAVGDVAAFYNPILGERLRVAYEDKTNMMGQLAGRAMAGEPEPYHHLPFFYSDLFELGSEALRDVSTHLETVADWKEPYLKGVVYYLRQGGVRGSCCGTSPPGRSRRTMHPTRGAPHSMEHLRGV
jgi:3-phenylpropionate/trans-cinnamate dioxygenase ferredoxin reductase component